MQVLHKKTRLFHILWKEPLNFVNFFHVFLGDELILSLLNPIVQTHLSEINQSWNFPFRNQQRHTGYGLRSLFIGIIFCLIRTK
ncbi:hypothetical protein LEP1GSC170_6265 [Leptospira interrogans serovar Bataviae str. HAI135]|nr:hypothetical protein LEP1GSC170_6265 [Leptospira interrogans serovar Bataviae str. HAI135]